MQKMSPLRWFRIMHYCKWSSTQSIVSEHLDSNHILDFIMNNQGVTWMHIFHMRYCIPATTTLHSLNQIMGQFWLPWSLTNKMASSISNTGSKSKCLFRRLGLWDARMAGYLGWSQITGPNYDQHPNVYQQNRHFTRNQISICIL